MTGASPAVLNEAEAQGPYRLPQRGRIRINFDQAGNIIGTSGTNLPTSLELSIARVAAESRPDLRMGSRPPAIRRWLAPVLMTFFAIRDAIEIVNAPPGEQLRTATGVAGSMASLISSVV